MTCQLQSRMDHLLSLASQVNEKITIWHGRDGSDLAQITVITDQDGPVTGQGATICEAMAALETQLAILPPAECLECGELGTFSPSSG